MPKGANQKLKLYYLYKILHDKTDDNHKLTMPEIRERLEGYGITADRKSLYDDVDALRTLGFDVIGEKDGRNYNYYMGDKEFEIAELKLLVDSIQSSKFITERKSNELIKKLTSFVSEYEALQLKRQVVVQGRIKTMNESIYYTVDEIHNAISSNHKIRFDYYNWNLEKKMVPRKDGKYEVSPWALTWDDENYYLVAYDSAAGKIKHYRVDKMRGIEMMQDRREGKEFFEKIDMAAYSRMNFGMFGGEKCKVKLKFKNEIVGVLLDRFGKDITIRSTDEEGWSEALFDVALSDQFLGWIFSLGTNVKIIDPEEAVNWFTRDISAVRDLY